MSWLFRIYAYTDESKLANLHDYKYHGEDFSLLAKYVMQPFWTRLALHLPAWLAPNLITLIGLAAMFVGYLAVFAYVPDLTSGAGDRAPAWVWILAATAVFAYQTLDALDGKQARRTGTSSPLGELFDHGCDAISTAMCVLLTSAALAYEPWMNTVSITVGMLAFYLGQWEEFHTGSLYLGYVNVTEATVTIQLVLLAAAAVGPSALRDAGVSAAIFYLSTFAALATCVQYAYRTLTLLRRSRKSVVGALQLLGPIIVLLSVTFGWARQSGVDVAANYHYAFANIVGLTGSALVGRLVLARMMKSTVSPWQWTLVPLIAVAANDALLDAPLVDPVLAISLLVAWSVVAYFHFAMYVITTLCATLDINCLTIKSRATGSAAETLPTRARSRSPARSRPVARVAKSKSPARSPSQRVRSEPTRLKESVRF